MRKIGQIFRFLIPVIALAVLVVFMTGAGRRRRAKVEEIRARARLAFEAWNTGNMDVFDEIYAPDYARHSYAPIGDEDLEATKQHALSLQKDYPGFQLTIDEHIIGHELDRGALRWTFRGTHTSGAQVTFTGCAAYHLGPDGKTVEEWIYEDLLALFQQLGFKLVPPK